MEVDIDYEENNDKRDLSFVPIVSKDEKEHQINSILSVCGAPNMKIKRAK